MSEQEQQQQDGIQIPAQVIIDRLRAEVANLNDQRVLDSAKIDYLTSLVESLAGSLAEMKGDDAEAPPMMIDNDIVGPAPMGTKDKPALVGD